MATTWKTVRVFISSTFRDMHAERDHLVKVVFPALRERLEKHRVHLIDIDLRWGVTKEQADNDQALDVCLDQIDACRPFFIGILGERYGWVSTKLPERVASKYGWVRHHTGKSITELEILYGVLNNPQMHSHAYFCFRDPKFLWDVPGELLRVFAEFPSDQELRDLTPRAARQCAVDRRRKLRELKTAIRNANLPTPAFENYPCEFAGVRINRRLARMELSESDRQALEQVTADGTVTPDEFRALDERLRTIVSRIGTASLSGLQEFGQRIHEWLWQAIKAELKLDDQPASEEIDPLAEESDFHKRFMESRLRVYVGRKDVRNDLARYADGDDKFACLVTGASGSGKSAALARFVRVYERARRSTLVIPHFIGASPRSTNLRDMLRRFCQVFKARFGFAEEVPEEAAKLSVTFREFVGRVPADTRVILVIDALNQLDEADRAQELYWLPRELPQQVKVIVSCISDTLAPTGRGQGEGEPVLEAFRSRKHCPVQLAALNDAERRLIIRQVPSLSAKTLDDDQVRLLLSNPATANPLFLLVALEELRGFAPFERLNERIADFPCEGDTVTAIFTQVIERLAAEFNPKLVETVLTLLASARRGLSERELQELVTGLDGADDLFPVLRQLRPYLLSRAGLIDFYHRNLFKAVRERWLPSEEQQRQAHVCLAEYFHAQDYWLDSRQEQSLQLTPTPPQTRLTNTRKVGELPWQLCEACLWQRLHYLLADLDFVECTFQGRFEYDSEFAYDASKYWVAVEKASPWRMVEGYRPILGAPGDVKNPHSLLCLYLILAKAGHWSEASSLLEHLVERARNAGSATLPHLLLQLSDLRQLQGDVKESNELLVEADRFTNALNEALRQSTIAEDTSEARWVKNSFPRVSAGEILARRAQKLRLHGYLGESLDLLTEWESICGELRDNANLARCLEMQAMIWDVRGDHGRALSLYKRVERTLREIGDQDLLPGNLSRQADILLLRADFSSAMTLLTESESIYRENGAMQGLADVLHSKAVIAQRCGDDESAMAILLEIEGICSRLGYKDGLQSCLGDQAALQALRGNPDKATALYRKQEGLCRELDNKSDLAMSLSRQASVLYSTGQLSRSMQLHKDAVRICREVGHMELLQACLGDQALVLRDSGDLGGAMALHQEQEGICRKLGDVRSLATSIGNQAVIIQQRGDTNAAIELLREQECLCRTARDQGGLGMSLGRQATILTERGELDAALKLLNESETIFRQLDHPHDLSSTLGNQANIKSRQGDMEGALALHREVERICRQVQAVQGIILSLANQAWLIATAMANPQEALRIMEQAQRLSNEHHLHGLAKQMQANDRYIRRAASGEHQWQWALGNEVAFHQARGNIEQAATILKDVEHGRRKIGDKHGVALCLGTRAALERARRNFNEAMKLHKDAEQLYRSVGNPDGTAKALADQALLLYVDMSRAVEALPLIEEAFRLAKGSRSGALAQQLKPLLNQVRSRTRSKRGGWKWLWRW